MASITYLYTVAEVVWVVNVCAIAGKDIIGLEKGTVQEVLIVVDATKTVIMYKVKIDGRSLTSNFLEADTFNVKANAITEYETRIAD